MGGYDVTLPLPGVHHATNAAAALAVGRWFGLAPEEIVARLRTFTPPAGRTQALRLGRVKVIDDTYNANPASMLAAVAALAQAKSGRRIMVMGDMLELGEASPREHLRVVAAVIEAGIEHLLVMGPESTDAARSLRSQMTRTRLVICSDHDQATAALNGLLRDDDVVWVKGSRRMELDRLVRQLEAQPDHPRHRGGVDGGGVEGAVCARHVCHCSVRRRSSVPELGRTAHGLAQRCGRRVCAGLVLKSLRNR